MTALWHGYPQPEGAHPKRPWWRKASRALDTQEGEQKVMSGWPIGTPGWVHPSGVFAFGDDAEEVMEQYDVEHPVPAPPPMGAQVWVKGSSQRVITRVETVDGGKTYVFCGPDRLAGSWPPEGYVLAAGPYAPWQSTGAE